MALINSRELQTADGLLATPAAGAAAWNAGKRPCLGTESMHKVFEKIFRAFFHHP